MVPKVRLPWVGSSLSSRGRLFVHRNGVKVKRSSTIFGAAFALFLCGPPSASAQDILGSAQGFAVLGGSTVTNTGTTVVTGNLGVSPGSSVTGFPPGIVIGTIHVADAVAQQAQADALTAYNDLAGAACDFDLTGQDLGGLTLVPGVYCFSSSAQLTGALTLDAQGSDSAEFIFKIATTLTGASGASVTVIDGGTDCGVFWQIGSSATIGSGATFVGNVLASASITLTTGAILSGRALALNGAVTLDTNLVTIPDECTCIPFWNNYGAGWPGTLGVPGIVLSNAPVIGGDITLTIDNSSNMPTVGWLIAGYAMDAASTPRDGTLLVAPPFNVSLYALPVGQLNIDGNVTAHHLCGFELFLQFVQRDPGASKGISFTPGVHAILGY